MVQKKYISYDNLTEFTTYFKSFVNGKMVAISDEKIQLLLGGTTDTDLPIYNTLPEGTLTTNVMYFLGTYENDIVIHLPEATNGEMIYVSFTIGDIVPSFQIMTDNYIGLDNLLLIPNYYYEIIGIWNGDRWVLSKNEVAQ